MKCPKCEEEVVIDPQELEDTDTIKNIDARIELLQVKMSQIVRLLRTVGVAVHLCEATGPLTSGKVRES